MTGTSGSYTPPSVAGAECPAPMTRAELLALRNSGGLELGCRYTITDPVQAGNFNPTALVFDAVSPTELDTEGEAIVPWSANPVTVIYNIDSTTAAYSRVIDNQRNDVTGTHAHIGAFPWGRRSVFANTVRNSTVNWTAGLLYQNEITALSTVNSSANTYRNKISRGTVTVVAQVFAENDILRSTVTTTAGSTTSWFGNEIHSSTVIMTGTGYVRNSKIWADTDLHTGNMAIVNSEFHNCRATRFTGSTGTVLRSKLSQIASGTRLRDFVRLNLWRVDINGDSRIAAAGPATLVMERSTMGAGSRVNLVAGSNVTIVDTTQERGIITETAGGFGLVQRSTVSGDSSIRFQSAASVSIANRNIVRNASLFDGSRLQFRGNSERCRFERSQLTGSSTANFANANNTIVLYSAAAAQSTIHADNDLGSRIYHSSATAHSSLVVRNPGAGNPLMYYCHAAASSTIVMRDCFGAARLYSITASSQSILRLQNGGGRLYYSSFTAYYYLFVTIPTGTTRNSFHGYGRRTNTLVNPPANGTFVQNF